MKITLAKLKTKYCVPFIRFKTMCSAECHFCVSSQCGRRRRRYDRSRNRRCSRWRQRLRDGSIQSFLARWRGCYCGWTVGRVSGAEGSGSPPRRHFLFVRDHLAHYRVRWRRWCWFNIPDPGIRSRWWWTRRRSARRLQTSKKNSLRFKFCLSNMISI